MWLAVDIGGTKTLLAVFNQNGEIVERAKFPTNADYAVFKQDLASNFATLQNKPFSVACVAAPGKIDRATGIATRFGNLTTWQDTPIKSDLQALTKCPVFIENDAKLAGLSAARALGRGKYHKVLYITISTGIGGGLIVNDIIDPDFADSEIGHMMLEHNGSVQQWQAFASGKAIVRRFNKLASEIDDPEIWKLISHDIAIGLIDVLANTQPDIVLIGGGVGTHFAKYGQFLTEELQKFATPMVSIPPIQQAANPEDAVIFGCYELMKDHETTTNTSTTSNVAPTHS